VSCSTIENGGKEILRHLALIPKVDPRWPSI
jgi:hypothetical protein